jgi:hypothetical protein
MNRLSFVPFVCRSFPRGAYSIFNAPGLAWLVYSRRGTMYPFYLMELHFIQVLIIMIVGAFTLHSYIIPSSSSRSETSIITTSSCHRCGCQILSLHSMMQIWPPRDGTSASSFWGARDVLPTYINKSPSQKVVTFLSRLTCTLRQQSFVFRMERSKMPSLQTTLSQSSLLRHIRFILYLRAWGRWGSNASLARLRISLGPNNRVAEWQLEPPPTPLPKPARGDQDMKAAHLPLVTILRGRGG